jgi:hypothetical protein
MKKAITFFLIFSTYFCYSQGYRDNKFSLSYQPAYSLIGTLSTKFLTHHKVNFGWSVLKHFSINSTFSYSKKDFFILDSELSGESFDGRIYKTFNIKDISGGINILYFRKSMQGYSPIGKYFGVGMDFGKQNSLSTLTNPNNPLYVFNYYTDLDRETLIMISAFIGRNFLIKEKVLLGYGIQFSRILNVADQPERQNSKPYFNMGYIF